ncbi:metal ABC transporter substrate-binding protein [Dietzia sp. NPDC055340]
MPKSRTAGIRNHPGGRVAGDAVVVVVAVVVARIRAACAAAPALPRRIAAAALALPLALSLTAGCAVPTTPGGDIDDRAEFVDTDDRLVVATTFTILADMARVVGGDRVQVESVTTPGADVHYYEPTAGDLRRVEGADLVISNGLGLDDWLLRFIDGTGARHVVTTDGIAPEPVRSGNSVGHPNPHAWMSPTDGAAYIRVIADALGEIDPAGAAGYTARADAYTAELEALAERARDAVATIPPERRVLVTCEGAFSYLARDLGLEELYLWPVNSENQGLPRQVTALIDEVREREVPALFCESTVSGDAMEQVASESGSRVAGLLYVDSLSAETGPVPTYLDLLDHDLHTITRELTA